MTKLQKENNIIRMIIGYTLLIFGLLNVLKGFKVFLRNSVAEDIVFGMTYSVEGIIMAGIGFLLLYLSEKKKQR